MRVAILCLSTILLYNFYFLQDETFSYQITAAPACFPVQHSAWVVFAQMFRSGSYFMPQDVTVLGADFNPANGHLTLDLSKEVLNYGGTYFEYKFIKLMRKNAAALPDVLYLTVLIEGILQPLPEGVEIEKIPLHLD